jgi:hypothetical protein
MNVRRIAATTTELASSRIHAHPDIAALVACQVPNESSQNSPLVHLDSSWRISFRERLSAPLPVEDLVALALDCERRVFSSEEDYTNVTSTISTTARQGLLRLGLENDPAQNAAATLLALNQVESAIRRRTSCQTGKAPLLKTMLADLVQEDPNLAYVLQSLLLPDGLNLRNLLWHGFCGSLPRAWLSLAVVLTETILDGCKSTKETLGTDEQTLLHVDPTLSGLVARYQASLPKESAALGWLPASHHDLWRLASAWMTDYPAGAIALLSVLLEHGLRLAWCEANDRPEDRVAQPRRFYVTLDGHGQRHQHDILVHPFCTGGARNALLQTLGGSATALVADLFCSATGPNLRAALAHGLWDVHLDEELARRSLPGSQSCSTGGVQQEGLRAYASVVHTALEMAAARCTGNVCLLQYRPQYSYTATTRKSLVDLSTSLKHLRRANMEREGGSTETVMPEYARTLQVSEPWLESQMDDMISVLTPGGTAWSVDDIYQEHSWNVLMGPLGATRTLATDIAEATESLSTDLDEAGRLLDDDSVSLSTRQRRRCQRMLTCGSTAEVFYGFVTKVVLLSLEESVGETDSVLQLNPKDRLKVVERSRMVVSTVATYLTTHTDRAYKAIEEYTKGKVVKLILAAQFPK